MRERTLPAALHVALLAAVAPNLSRPFYWPKLAVLCAGAALAFCLPARRSPPERWVWPLAWLALAAASAIAHPGALEPVLLDGAAALLLCALFARRWDADFTLRAIAWLGCGEAALVVAQRALAAGGVAFAAAQGRMALFGSLGNPDFAAAYLGAALCLALGARLYAAAALQLLALALLGSFASVLALGAALVVALSAALARRALAASGLAVLCLGATAGGRDLADRIAGRAYLHRVAAAHLLDAPLLGAGPGSLRVQWPAWEAERFARGLEPASSRRFAAPQDHAHDDFLERALEQGWPAALGVLLLAAVAIARGRTRRPWAAAALASLAARALVDFPLARPAELALFVTLAAACLEDSCPTAPAA